MVVFHLTVDGSLCQPVVDIVDILLLDVLGRPGQAVAGVIVGESFRIGWIFRLLQAVELVVGVERLTCQLVFLDALAVAVIAVGVLREDFVGRGYRQTYDILVRIVGDILPHAVGMGDFLDGTIGIAGKFDN